MLRIQDVENILIVAGWYLRFRRFVRPIADCCERLASVLEPKNASKGIFINMLDSNRNFVCNHAWRQNQSGRKRP